MNRPPTVTITMNTTETTLPDLFDGAEIIHAYTRADAIEDGTLVDVTEWASNREMSPGFTIPVAVTSAVWSMIENIPKSLEGIADVRGRAHDVLWMGLMAAKRLGDETRGLYKVSIPSKGTRKRIRLLVIDIGPGDEGEPVITIGTQRDF